MSVAPKNKINEQVFQKGLQHLYDEALTLKNEKDYINAIDAYHKLIAYKNDATDCVECAKLYEDLGDIYFELKDSDKAFEYMGKALKIYADNNAYELQLNQYKKIGGLQQGIWQFNKSIDIFQQGLSLATRLNKQDKIVEFELLLGNVLNWADKLKESEKYLKSAIKKEALLNIPLVKLRAHASYAILLRKMRKFKEAEKYFKLCMKLSSQNNNAYLMDITKSYGIMHCEMGNYSTAETLLLDAEKQAILEGNDATRSVIFEYLSLVYQHLCNYEKAYYYIKKFYERKLELLEKGYSDDNNILQAKIGLEDAKRERLIAEEAAKAKSLFIATISHEIRTPMNIILGTSNLMLNDNPKPEHVRYLQTLTKSGENLLGLINDILDVSKIEAGKLEIDTEAVSIHKIFENIYLVMEQSALEKNICLTYKIDDKINSEFYNDALRLTQIVTNLLSNAIKFTNVGTVHFEAALSTPNNIQLIVTDSGIGIPKNKLHTIFEQYEQVKNKSQKKYKGTGLGLSICKKLVEMMQGKIEVKSKVNTGTQFIITLPFVKVETPKNSIANTLPVDNNYLDNKLILLVDDIDENRFVLKETLLFFNKNIKIIEAEDGKQVLASLQKHHPDLIIMDLDMPIMNGFETLAAIRKSKQLKQLKVVASTASIVTNSEDELLEFGFNAYLPKPFDIAQFRSLLENLLL